MSAREPLAFPVNTFDRPPRQSKSERLISPFVTTGKRKGFSGLAEVHGVLVVAPLAAIPLATLLRDHLVEIVKANVVRDKRAQIGQKLLKHVMSPQFRNPIEEVVRLSSELQEMITDEAKAHYRIWERRWNSYQRIRWDSSQIAANVQTVLEGKEARSITHPKHQPLELPAPSLRKLSAKVRS